MNRLFFFLNYNDFLVNKGIISVFNCFFNTHKIIKNKVFNFNSRLINNEWIMNLAVIKRYSLPLKMLFLILNFSFLMPFTPSVFGQKNAKITTKKEAKNLDNFNGSWWGKGTVDYGFGNRTEFEYELILEQKRDGKITGVSITFLKIGGKRYCAKALVEGKWNKTYLNCAEKYNITEDKLPESNWIPFTKMELIFKMDGVTPTLEGMYECQDGSNGRLLLKRKPPQV
jgi:hypothetical protein